MSITTSTPFTFDGWSDSVTASITLGANAKTLLAAIFVDSSSTAITGATWNGAAMTLVQSTITAGNKPVALYSADVSGDGTITADAVISTDAASGISVVAFTLDSTSNIAMGTPGTPNSNTTSSASCSTSVSAGDFLLSVLGWDGNSDNDAEGRLTYETDQSLIATAGQDSDPTDSAVDGMVGVYSQAAAASGTQYTAWLGGDADDWAAFGVPFTEGGMTISVPPESFTRASATTATVANTSTTGLTTADFTATLGGQALTVDGLVDNGDNSYVLTLGVPSAIALQHDASGYTLTIAASAAPASAANIPLNPPDGYSYVNLAGSVVASPQWTYSSAYSAGDTVYWDRYIYTRDSYTASSTAEPADGVDGWTETRLSGSALDGYTGDAPVAGDQCVHTHTDGSVGFTVEPDGNWVLDPPPISDVQMRAYVISADGSIGSEGVRTFTTNADATPDQFTIADKTDVALGSTVVSDPITITGINTDALASISGGEYAVNLGAGWGAYTTADTYVPNGAQIRLRQTAPATFSTASTATLTVGGISDGFAVTTLAEDTDPHTFSFAAQTDVAINSTVTSETITVSGINAPAAISISGTTGATYSINGGTATAASGTVSLGDEVVVTLPTSASFSATTAATLTIGSVSATLSATTIVEPDSTPAAFSFADKLNVALDTKVASEQITVSGINMAAPISVTGGTYSINGGAETAADGTVNDGDRVIVFLQSSASYSTESSATLSVGGVSAAFTATTLAAGSNEAPTLNDATLTISEAAAVGSLVGTLSATDPNLDALSYRITGGNTDAVFILDASTGRITTTKTLNYSVKSSYALTVEVTDGSLTDTAVITVQVQQATDNTAPTTQDASFSVSESATVGTIVGTVTATDPEADALTYAIVYGNEGGAFAIDANSGQITVAGALDYGLRDLYQLVVVAEDPAGESAGAAITIAVTQAGITYPDEQSILGTPSISPGLEGAEINTLYPGNSHVAEIKNLRLGQSRALISGATVTVTLKDASGSNLAGTTWPITLAEAVPGHYWNGVSSALELAGVTEAVAEFTATDGTSKAFWRIELAVADRVR